jgi:hypothetical protein
MTDETPQSHGPGCDPVSVAERFDVLLQRGTPEEGSAALVLM